MCIILVVAIRLLICQMGEVEIPPPGRQTNKQIATADSPWDCLNQIYETLMSKVGGKPQDIPFALTLESPYS